MAAPLRVNVAAAGPVPSCYGCLLVHAATVRPQNKEHCRVLNFARGIAFQLTHLVLRECDWSWLLGTCLESGGAEDYCASVCSRLCFHHRAVTKHRMGCRILCRLLEFCSTDPNVGQLIDELLEAVAELCRHSFAHHVIQSVLEHGGSGCPSQGIPILVAVAEGQSDSIELPH